MATDIFLKIDDLKGESKDKTHSEKIDVLSFSWGSSNNATFGAGGGGGSSKVTVQNLSLTKRADQTSPDLWLACANGKHFKTAELILRKAGENPLEYLKYKFTDIMVSSISIAASGHDDIPNENVTLAFSKFAIVYTPQKQDGTGGKVAEIGWDIMANAKV